MSIDAIPEQMPWGEALRITSLLRRDPSSWLAASMEGWDYPLDRATAATLDLFDLEHAKASKRTPKPHGGRPWVKDKSSKRYGNAGGLTHERVREILRAAGHDL